MDLPTLESYKPPVTSPFFAQNSQAADGKPPKQLHQTRKDIMCTMSYIIADLPHLIFEDCNYKPSLFLKKKLFHENFMRRINEQPIYLYTRAITNAHPMPHSSQQASRSSAEISTEILPPLWIHNLSDIASAAPKACVKIKPGTLRTWKLVMIFLMSHPISSIW